MTVSPFPPLNQQACHNCRYSRHVQGQDDLVSCRRNSPSLQAVSPLDKRGLTWGCWPVVLTSSWCGEWVAAEGN